MWKIILNSHLGKVKLVSSHPDIFKILCLMLTGYKLWKDRICLPFILEEKAGAWEWGGFGFGLQLCCLPALWPWVDTYFCAPRVLWSTKGLTHLQGKLERLQEAAGMWRASIASSCFCSCACWLEPSSVAQVSVVEAEPINTSCAATQRSGCGTGI